MIFLMFHSKLLIFYILCHNIFSIFKVPPIISGSLSDGRILNSEFIDIEENVWKYLEGKEDFGECMANTLTPKCTSIFDPEPKKNQ